MRRFPLIAVWAIILWLLVPLIVFAQNSDRKPWVGRPENGWYLYWLGLDGTEAYVHFDDYYHVFDDRVLVGTLLNYPKSGKTAVVAEIFDCLLHRVALVNRREYDRDHNLVLRIDIDTTQRRYEDVVKDSRQDWLLNGVCTGRRIASLSEARTYFKERDKEVRRIRDEQ